MRVRPEQVSKLRLRMLRSVQLQRDSLLSGSVPDSETRSLLYWWRRYNFRDAQFVVLFSSVQLQKQGVVLLTYLQPQKQVVVLFIYLQPQRHAVVLFTYLQPQRHAVVLFTYLQPQRHALSCSSFKKIAFSFRTMKEEGLRFC
jgi:hypothetical protein